MSPSVARSSSPLSQGIRFGNLLFLSGQLGRDPATGKLEAGFEAQARRTMTNLRDLLESAGSSMDMVLKTTVFVTDLARVGELNSIYREFFNNPLPARSCVEVSALAGGAEVEIELIAACPED
jgi:2-iminobutanoate/2-iminopropanoate deaminase